MRTAPSTAATSAVPTGAVEVRTPIATPVSATCPRPSPSRDSRRCTRKTPTAGATRPTISDASSARCMKPYSRTSTSAPSVRRHPRLVLPVPPRGRQTRVLGVVVPVGTGLAPGPRERAVVGDAPVVDDDRAGEDAGQRGGLVGHDQQGGPGGRDVGQDGGQRVL